MSAVLARGRFLIDSRPVPFALARDGFIHRWTVLDFDDPEGPTEHNGLAVSLPAAELECVTKVTELLKATRRPQLEVVPDEDYPTRPPVDELVPGMGAYRPIPVSCARCDRLTHLPVPWFGDGEDPNLDVLVCVRCHPSFSAQRTSTTPPFRTWRDRRATTEEVAQL